ncbi:MAG: Gfo/Idh/MocA family oxidoreductase [Patescibacteria group bacterium]
MSKKVKFGIIGFGNIGTRYKKRIDENPSAELVAIAEIKRKKLESIKNKSIKKYKNYKKLIQNPDVDVVIVAVPNYLHKQLSIEALDASKHVVCEKPMAIKTLDANQMILASQKTNKKLFVVKQNRFNPPVKKVKELIENNKLGKIGLVVVNCYWNRNNEYYKKSDWRGRKKEDGGTIFTQFSHFVDIVYFLMGDFINVSAEGFNFNHKKLIEFEDTGVVRFKMANGALGSLNYTTCSYAQNMEGSITLFGEKGTVKIGGQYLNTLDYYKIEKVRKINLEKGNTANDYGSYKGSMSNHGKIIKNVIGTLQGNGFVATSAFEGMKIVQVIEAMYESMKSNGKTIKIH